MRIESTRLIHNNIHNTQMVIHNLINIHKLINIHESTLFEILPGGNTVGVCIRYSYHNNVVDKAVSCPLACVWEWLLLHLRVTKYAE